MGHPPSNASLEFREIHVTIDYKHLVDVGAAGGVISTLMGWLPPIAAALGILWYIICIYEYVKAKLGSKS